MRQTEGDILQLAVDGRIDILVHGCNCHCTMGAGIARAIKLSFPEAYRADLATKKGDRSKLGTLSIASVEREGSSFTVVNGYTQFDWRGRGVRADYAAIRRVMKAVKSCFAGQRIGYPKIGAGLAKGDWSEIANIIDEELDGEDHVLVVLPSGSRRTPT